MELVSAQNYDSITVRDIAIQAQVGYKTFYRHYQSKDDLLQSLVDKLRAELQDLLLPPTDERATEQNTITTLAYAEAHGQVLLTILNSSAVEQLLSAWHTVAEEEGRQTFRSPAIPAELVAHHFAASMISLLRWWLELGMDYPKEEMAHYIHQLVIDPLKHLEEQRPGGIG